MLREQTTPHSACKGRGMEDLRLIHRTRGLGFTTFQPTHVGFVQLWQVTAHAGHATHPGAYPIWGPV